VLFGSDHPANFNDGGTGAASAGGAGGSIDGVKGIARTAQFIAQTGGAADGTGGDGGALSHVTFAVTKLARTVAAGRGGGVAAGGTAGLGGSISNVKITGTGVIGDWASNFGLDATFLPGMGGLIAGLGGAVAGVFDSNRNGSITTVTATKIAAIFAGANGPFTSVSSFNAVKSITALTAAFIGADVDGDRQFDWTENAVFTGFQLNNNISDMNDVPLDGFVLVRIGGYTPAPATQFLAVPGVPLPGIIFV
jgi:hypothetical protein